MKKIIFRNLTNVKFQQLKNAISKDKLRPQLMGVFLDVKNEKIVVTNGNVLVAYDIEIIDGELKKEAIIDPKIFNQNNWISVPKQDLELVEFHVTEDKTEVMLGEDVVAVAKNIETEVAFPQWKHVFTDNHETAEFMTRTEFVKQLLSAIPPIFYAPKFHVGKKLIVEAEIDAKEDGTIKVQGLAMTHNFDEEDITNQSEEVKINYEENGKVPTEIVKKLMGRKTSRRVLKTWNEDFVDEDNGEVVSIERNEIIVDKNTIIDRDVLDEIINVQAKSVFIHKYQ